MDISIRPAEPDDAARLLELKSSLDRETRSMMLEPDEREDSVGNERRHIERICHTINSAIFIAVAGDVFAGYLEISGGEFRRNHHVGQVVVGVRSSWSGQGIGTRLFESAIGWARDRDLKRLELSVLVDNVAAIRLYEKFKFSIEGTRRASMRIDGKLHDEYWMALILDD